MSTLSTPIFILGRFTLNGDRHVLKECSQNQRLTSAVQPTGVMTASTVRSHPKYTPIVRVVSLKQIIRSYLALENPTIRAIASARTSQVMFH